MALSTFPFLTQDNLVRYRSVNGAGTIADPDVAVVEDIVGNLVLNGITSKLPTLGQKAISGSISVTPATNASILVTPVAYSNFARIGTSSGTTIKTSPGTLYSVACTNINATVRYLQLFDKITGPVLGDVPVAVYPVYGNNHRMIDTTFWGLAGFSFDVGIAWGISTTPLTFTVGSGVDTIFEANFL